MLPLLQFCLSIWDQDFLKFGRVDLLRLMAGEIKIFGNLKNTRFNIYRNRISDLIVIVVSLVITNNYTWLCFALREPTVI